MLEPTSVFYLEMDALPQDTLTLKSNTDFQALAHPLSVETYRYYYAKVGLPYHWLDRLVMPDEELFSKINAPNTHQFIFTIDAQQAGFVEFIVENDFVEIQYFGLFPEFVGKGYGKYFLRWAIQKAWSWQTKKVQLNTCSLDHPAALDVYKSVGFVETHSTIEQRKVLTN
jgi:GNAT superfamily N-acetyltransferase